MRYKYLAKRKLKEYYIQKFSLTHYRLRSSLIKVYAAMVVSLSDYQIAVLRMTLCTFWVLSSLKLQTESTHIIQRHFESSVCSVIIASVVKSKTNTKYSQDLLQIKSNTFKLILSKLKLLCPLALLFYLSLSFFFFLPKECFKDYIILQYIQTYLCMAFIARSGVDINTSSQRSTTLSSISTIHIRLSNIF